MEKPVVQKVHSQKAMGSARLPSVLIVAPRINYLSRELPRLFHRAGARVVFASPPDCSVRASRYLHAGLDFDSSQPDAVASLERMLAEVDPALLVIVEEPFFASLLGLPRERAPRVWQHLRGFPEQLASRGWFHVWAQAAGLGVPPGEICREAQEVHAALDRWGEVFVKRDGTSGGAGVRRVAVAEEVAAAWGPVEQGTVLVQKALGGEVGVTDMVVHHGRLLAWTSSQKWRTVTPNGPSVARLLCVPEGMAELAGKLAELTNFHGLCGFDWVIDTADGRPRLIEFHPRPPSGFGIGRWAGVAFEEAIAALLGLAPERSQVPDPDAFAAKPVCCYFPDHLLTSLKRGDFAELRRWLPGSNSRSWAMVPWDDPRVLWRMVMRLVWR